MYLVSELAAAELFKFLLEFAFLDVLGDVANE
jgi:hypothetical protein